MQLKVILNRIHKHKSFVYGADRLYEECGRLRLDVDILPSGQRSAEVLGMWPPETGL